jgi:hypothetical protein
LYRAYSLPLKSQLAEILAPRVFWANLMHFTVQNFEKFHTNFDKTIDAPFGSLAVRRKKNKNDIKIIEFQMICNIWKVYARIT